jgi:hypothetical protein
MFKKLLIGEEVVLQYIHQQRIKQHIDQTNKEDQKCLKSC